jgi:uncharacterized protein (TIGR01777 family)
MNEYGSGVVELPKKIVLSGASGGLGTAIRAELALRGMPVLQLVRGVASAEGQVGWDPGRWPALENPEPFEGCAAAIHLSGANLAGRRWTEDYRRAMVASRVDSTRALAKTLAGLRTPPRVLVVSSAVGIYGDRGNLLADESSEPGDGFLAAMCRLWEEAAQPAVDAGIRVVHARFGVVLGRGPGALQKILPLFRLGLGGRLGSGRQWMSWISLEDTVAAVLFAVKNDSLGGPVNVTAPTPVTNAEFTQALGRAVHRPAILPAPAFVLRIVLGQMADEALLTSTRAVPKRLLEAGFTFKHPVVEEALAAIR